MGNLRGVRLENEFGLDVDGIREKARRIRRRILRMNFRAGQGHTGADLSEVDILTSLYFRILRIRRNRLKNVDRDRFIQSKGHGVGGLYCTLAEAGYLDRAALDTYLELGGLPGHPERQKTPGVELNTGALGHGLSVGVGLALAGKLKGRSYRVFVLTGDGELQEGSNWEAAMSASRFKLDNLIVINDRNTLQLADRTEVIMPLEPLAEKWRAFGFDVMVTDGNDVAAFVETVEGIDTGNGRPHVVIARTTKGKGVSFIEDRAAWHHRTPTEDELSVALRELEGS